MQEIVLLCKWCQLPSSPSKINYTYDFPATQSQACYELARFSTLSPSVSRPLKLSLLMSKPDSCNYHKHVQKSCECGGLLVYVSGNQFMEGWIIVGSLETTHLKLQYCQIYMQTVIREVRPVSITFGLIVYNTIYSNVNCEEYTAP